MNEDTKNANHEVATIQQSEISSQGEETQTAENTEPKVETEVLEQPNPSKEKNRSEGFKTLPYFENARVICACGNTFTTGSTKEEIRVEICNNCHPFFTGQEKFVDTEGRVERFKRMESSKQSAKPKKEVERKDERPKTLKEMLQALENR
jgi:large subunit ribosomal protein L31